MTKPMQRIAGAILDGQTRGFVTEAGRRAPVLADVDVVVAGAGLCASFAAIAAGRCGARTLLVERFGAVGGNIGPGLVINGGLYNEADTTLPGGLSGLAKEFIERLESYRVRPGKDYFEEASIASYVLYDMMKQAGVELLLSAWAADPILRRGVVRGLFVEARGGRRAVRARVTVDGTGDGDIARRAGAEMVAYVPVSAADAPYYRANYRKAEYPTLYNDTQLLFLIAGARLKRYQAFCERRARLSAEDRKWTEVVTGAFPRPLVPALRRAWEGGEFRHCVEPLPGVSVVFRPAFADYGGGLAAARCSAVGAFDSGDAVQMSRIEETMRALAFRAVDFFRRHAEGFERAYLVFGSPFLGARGGPHVRGEHTLTPQECFAGRKCDDALYRNIHEMNHGGDPSGFDVPYGAVIPKGLDGLLVAGRGAAYLRRGHDPTGMRARPSMMVFGQCIGTAAAIAALDGVSARNVDIRKVQRRLVKDGICLGDEARLKDLGLR